MEKNRIVKLEIFFGEKSLEGVNKYVFTFENGSQEVFAVDAIEDSIVQDNLLDYLDKYIKTR